ncbi:MAG: hypothetical protein ACXAC8_05045 [Candidatus Hodarchaeales archaeon]
MKKNSILLLKIFVVTLILWNFPILSSATTPISVSNSFMHNSVVTSEKSVEIFQVVQTGPSLSITLDYDLNSTSQLEENELLSVLVVFGNQEDHFAIQAAMFFLHTQGGQHYLFWMLGDPYRQAQNWQMGTENGHFIVDNELLTLFFIEFSDINNQEMETSVLAQISPDSGVNQQTNDFRILLDQFISELPISYLSISYSTSDESSQSGNGFLSPGFTILSALGIFLSALILKKFRGSKTSK